jgi:hypothetical protein
MNYTHPEIHSLATGNNAISYNDRKQLLDKQPTLSIPSLVTIDNIDQVKLGTSLVFEELDDKGKLHSCT